MADLYPAQPDEASNDAKPSTPADLNAEKATLFGTLAHLWPYIWPGDRDDLKMRVVWSMVLLLVAKAATLFVPFTFKWAVDALTGADTAPVSFDALEQIACESERFIADRVAADHDVELWRHSHRHDGADAVARRPFRQSGDACGAQAGLSHLRAHA